MHTFFITTVKSIQKQNYFSLKPSISYYSYVSTLWRICTDNAVHGTVYISSIIEKLSSREEKI